MAQGHLARDNLKIKFFKLDSWSPGAGFFLTIKDKRFGLSNNFIIIKREISTHLKNFLVR